MKRTEASLSNLWVNLDDIKRMEIQVIVVPEEEKRKALRKFLKKL